MSVLCWRRERRRKRQLNGRRMWGLNLKTSFAFWVKTSNYANDCFFFFQILLYFSYFLITNSDYAMWSCGHEISCCAMWLWLDATIILILMPHVISFIFSRRTSNCKQKHRQIILLNSKICQYLVTSYYFRSRKLYLLFFGVKKTFILRNINYMQSHLISISSPHCFYGQPPHCLNV